MSRDCYVSQFVEHPMLKEADGLPKRGALVFHTTDEAKARSELAVDPTLRHLFTFEGETLVEESTAPPGDGVAATRWALQHPFLEAKARHTQRNRVEAEALLA